MPGGPGLGAFGERAVAVLEKRPGQKAAVGHYVTSPPATTIDWPVIAEAASEQRKATEAATSSRVMKPVERIGARECRTAVGVAAAGLLRDRARGAGCHFGVCEAGADGVHGHAALGAFQRRARG